MGRPIIGLVVAGLLAVAVFGDGTVAAAWRAQGTYGILKDLGSVIGASLSLCAALWAGYMAWTAARAQYELACSEQRQRAIAIIRLLKYVTLESRTELLRFRDAPAAHRPLPDFAAQIRDFEALRMSADAWMLGEELIIACESGQNLIRQFIGTHGPDVAGAALDAAIGDAEKIIPVLDQILALADRALARHHAP